MVIHDVLKRENSDRKILQKELDGYYRDHMKVKSKDFTKIKRGIMFVLQFCIRLFQSLKMMSKSLIKKSAGVEKKKFFFERKMAAILLILGFGFM